MKNNFLAWSFFLITFTNVIAQTHTISGYVKDFDTGEVLIGANVYDQKTLKGTTTNNYGFFSLTLPEDSVKLTISFVGYAIHQLNIELKTNLEFNIDLKSGELLNEVVVTAEAQIEETTEMSLIRVPIKQIASLPALMGETDVMKVLQLLPGVQSGVEGSSGVYVRGGGPDQNLILLDGVPVYNASHLFGAFSVFNTEAINNIELIKGGFPARYGGRLSSVIDITMKEGNKKKMKASGSLGLISSQITVDGPIKDENTTFLFSARRTYLDLITRPIVKFHSGGDSQAGYYFYDLNFKISHRFSNKDRIFLSAYNGLDKAFAIDKFKYVDDNITYKYRDKFGLDWGNITSSLRWNHVFTPKLFLNSTLTYSKYQFEVFGETMTEEISFGSSTIEEFNYKYYSGIQDFSAKAEFEWLPSSKQQIRFGGQAIRHAFNPGVIASSSTFLNDTTFGADRTSAIEAALYMEDDIILSESLKVNLGVHSSAFFVKNRQYFSVQPRLAMRYLIGRDMSFKASYSEMTQFIHLLTNSGIGLPTDLWVPATDKVLPQNSKQAAIGLARTVKKDYEVSLEGYYKTMNNLIEYKEGASFLSIDQNWESKVTSGAGTSYGVELFVQKKVGLLSGWVGYTYSNSTRQFDDLNFGREFPYKYDRRHDFSVVGIYKFNEKIELSGTWVYGTGNAVSLPVSLYKGYSEHENRFNFNSIKYYEGRNGFRMKPYHRLDIGISFKKEKKWGEREWVFGIYNVYNRKNPFFIDIGYDYNTHSDKFIQYSLFPIIPSFSYKFKFTGHE